MQATNLKRVSYYTASGFKGQALPADGRDPIAVSLRD